jgi:hypothetical protein
MLKLMLPMPTVILPVRVPVPLPVLPPPVPPVLLPLMVLVRMRGAGSVLELDWLWAEFLPQ